jgi:hypothetical protein
MMPRWRAFVTASVRLSTSRAWKMLADVGLDGALADGEVRGDLLVRGAFRHELEDLELAFRDRR